jgi:hypothetical protein
MSFTIESCFGEAGGLTFHILSIILDIWTLKKL